jgi:hypothetical protein
MNRTVFRNPCAILRLGLSSNPDDGADAHTRCERALRQQAAPVELKWISPVRHAPNPFCSRSVAEKIRRKRQPY